jgi:hypothetical protein
LGKPFRWQVAAQSFFARPIEDESGHCGLAGIPVDEESKAYANSMETGQNA